MEDENVIQDQVHQAVALVEREVMRDKEKETIKEEIKEMTEIIEDHLKEEDKDSIVVKDINVIDLITLKILSNGLWFCVGMLIKWTCDALVFGSFVCRVLQGLTVSLNCYTEYYLCEWPYIPISVCIALSSVFIVYHLYS